MKYHAYLSRFLLISIPVSLCFSHRLNSVVIILYVIAVLGQQSFRRRFREAFRQGWIYPFAALYLLHLVSLLWTENLDAGLFILEKKAALVFLPLAIALDKNIDLRAFHQALAGFVAACFLALCYCLVHAFFLYYQLKDPELFFYHALATPLGGMNAIYFSFYLFMALVFLDYLSRESAFPRLQHQGLRWLLTAAFCLGIILLASRLFILLTLLYFLHQAFRHYPGLQKSRRLKTHWLLGMTILLSGFFLFGFTQDRFRHLLDSRFEVLQQEQFRWDTNLNGLTLRLLFLRFGWEILRENRAIVTGVGAGDAQEAMNATMISHNLYHGNPELGDRGYLDYNFHNQYMELWVQTGLLGLLLWLVIQLQPLTMTGKENWAILLSASVAAMICFSLIESLLERQRGVVFAAFFFSLFYRIKSKRP